jgi:uncharacterized protein (DUF3084 family)
MEITTSLDWQKIRIEMITISKGTGKYQHEMIKIIENLDLMVSELSKEEVKCRQQHKQTQTHRELVNKINNEIANYEQMITFGTLLNG